MREAGAAQGGEEGGPGRGRARKGKGGGDVGVEREDGGEGGFGEDGELRGRPVETEIAEDAAEQDDVAEVAAADDEDVGGVGEHGVFSHGGHEWARRERKRIDSRALAGRKTQAAPCWRS